MTQLGKGRAAAMTPAEMAVLADELGCHPADLEAIAEVESSGFGWFRDGRIKILFEKHWFYKLVRSGAKRTEAVRRGLARRSWVSPSKGGYRDQSSADQRYRLLQAAMALDREVALQSVSIGRFQIMGFNHAICGFSTAEEMWAAFLDSEANQLRAFGNFLKSKGLVAALRSRDFAKIEKGYNGGGLEGRYARRMQAASDKLRAGKWRDYEPESMAASVPADGRHSGKLADGRSDMVDHASHPSPGSPRSVSAGELVARTKNKSSLMVRAILSLISSFFGRRERPNWVPDADLTSDEK